MWGQALPDAGGVLGHTSASPTRHSLTYDHRMRIAVNHLTFEEPIPPGLIDSAKDAAGAVTDAGGELRLVKVDDTHAFLVLGFPDAETEERIKTEVGGPWMREHVIPLLASTPERTSGDVVAG